MVTFTTPVIGTSPRKLEPFRRSRAARLGPDGRRDLALRVLARDGSLTRLAADTGVSRKFLYTQAARAEDALDAAFETPPADDEVLFRLPVTKRWIHQFVVAQVLIGHSSFRGVIELLRDLFDYTGISLGTVHNIVQEAVTRARDASEAEDLARIRIGAHDARRSGPSSGADLPGDIPGRKARPRRGRREIDLLLPSVRRRPSRRDDLGRATLGTRRAGTQPRLHDRRTKVRFHKAVRTVPGRRHGAPCGPACGVAGRPVPPVCRQAGGDVFHAEAELTKLVSYLENRAKGLTAALGKLERRMERAKKRGRGNTLSKKLAVTRTEEAKAVELAQDIRTLSEWMQTDILSLAGPALAARRELFDFVVQELRGREPLCPHRIGPVRRTLENQRDDLLAFSGVLDEKLADIARRFAVPSRLVHGICELHGLDRNRPYYWQREAELRRKLRGTFHDIEAAIIEAMADTPRASSIIENLNSRLRNYFFLRRHIGGGYLDLLRFFLNHRRFIRSDRPERVGKTPAELLTGEAHPHWLELLGFEMFSRN